MSVCTSCQFDMTQFLLAETIVPLVNVSTEKLTAQCVDHVQATVLVGLCLLLKKAAFVAFYDVHSTKQSAALVSEIKGILIIVKTIKTHNGQVTTSIERNR